MKLLFTGDINFRGLSEPNAKMCSDILAEVLPYFERSDFRIINLETPLANKEKHTPIKKSGPNLICAPNNILFLETLHTDVCTLANNHIGDFGEGAVIDTLKLLDNYFSGWAYLHKWVPQAPSNYFDLKEYNSSENYNLISCESHLSQAKKVLEFCFLDRVAEAKEWSQKVAELTRMPV